MTTVLHKTAATIVSAEEAIDLVFIAPSPGCRANISLEIVRIHFNSTSCARKSRSGPTYVGGRTKTSATSLCSEFPGPLEFACAPLDFRRIFPYSLKYGNAKSRCGSGRACPGQSPGDLPPAGPDRSARHGRRPSG